MSRIESGREILNKCEFPLGTMLEQISSRIRAQCAEKGISYECRILGDADGHYYGDDIKLKEVLLNVLSNSVKFTQSSGSIVMTVEKTAEYGDQSTLRFCIKDTGIGMDKEYIPRIFDPFSQENAGGKSNPGGSGLGLPIAKRLIELMSGSISVESEKGKGTVFTVTVTLLRGGGSEAKHFFDIDLSAVNILVVDDNPIEAEHAKMVLEEAGIRTEICTSGQEALRKIELRHARKEPYTIVLMDWNMPGMNGRETSAEIFRLYGKESIIAAMTAYSWEDIREEAHSVGVEDHLEKPLFAANIAEALRRIASHSNIAAFRTKNAARLEGRRILLAEDVPINAEIMTDILEMENIKVDHAENGKIAVELFENSTAGIYSAILMDVRMPLMDGLEAARTIRALSREDAKRIPIIALTANAFDEDIKLSLQAGMNAHLTKPVESEHLIRVLGELIYEAEESLPGV